MDLSVFEDYIGQRPILDQLLPELQAAAIEGRPVRHMILYSIPGLGKDHLVDLIVRALGAEDRFVQIFGSDIAKAGKNWEWSDVFDRMDPRAVGTTATALPLAGLDINGHGLLVAPWQPRVVFLNECESAPRSAMESIHGVLQPNEYGQLSCTQTINRRRNWSHEVWVPPLTMILATNFLDELVKNCPAVVDRCPLQFEFQLYNLEELAKIVLKYSYSRKVPIAPEAAIAIGQRGKGTPRRVLQAIWPACNNERVLNRHTTLTVMHVQAAMKRNRIDDDGLDMQDIKYLRILFEQGNHSGVGLSRLAGLMGLPAKIITQNIEPWLTSVGYCSVDSSGRVLTQKGLTRLNTSGHIHLHVIERSA